MSLMNLLSVSRTFGGAQYQPGKYKLGATLLPKFAPAKRPISLRPAALMPTPTPVAAVPRAMETPSLFDPPPLRRQAGSAGPAQTSPAVLAAAEAPKALAKKAASAKPIERVARPLPTPSAKEGVVPLQAQTAIRLTPARTNPGIKTSFWERLLFWRSRRRSAATAVQTEWALEQVTVLRNDLSDSDIEVVPVRATPASPAHESTWTRLAGRFFRPNNEASPFSGGEAAANPAGNDGSGLSLPAGVEEPELLSRV